MLSSRGLDRGAVRRARGVDCRACGAKCIHINKVSEFQRERRQMCATPRLGSFAFPGFANPASRCPLDRSSVAVPVATNGTPCRAGRLLHVLHYRKARRSHATTDVIRARPYAASPANGNSPTRPRHTRPSAHTAVALSRLSRPLSLTHSDTYMLMLVRHVCACASPCGTMRIQRGCVRATCVRHHETGSVAPVSHTTTPVCFILPLPPASVLRRGP